MPELQRLRADHESALLDFEVTNRAYFARFISDRGDAFFERFAEGYDALLAEQSAGRRAGYVLVEEDGSVVGRFNLFFAGAGTAELGYRMAEHAAGRGLATAAVREVCGLASSEHGVGTVRAATSLSNLASQRVLEKAGFTRIGPADLADVGGQAGHQYELTLGQA